MRPGTCRRAAAGVGDGWRGGRRAGLLAVIGLLVVAGSAWAQGVVVKDDLCGLFDATGALQFGAFGLSTLAPNGVLHLVCRLRVPAPGRAVRLGPSVIPVPCGIEGAETWTWEERISPSGQAVLECWMRPGGKFR
jgi:hypothetical protein